MLTDIKLKSLKPEEKPYKLSDRDGLYVTVLTTGTVSFRYNYRINGRQETLVLGRYGPGGLTLSEARVKLTEAKKGLVAGKSPSRQKAREKHKAKDADSFGEWTELWLKNHQMAESTRDMRRSVFERDLKAPFGRLKMGEVSHEDLRSLCDKIVERGAPATAVHAREVVHMVYRYALERGHKFENPAELVRPISIARFQPRDRSLSSAEIGLLYQYLERVSTAPTIRLAVKLLLLTMLRKSELVEAVWDEINFTDAVWMIPAERMKRRTPHNIYLSNQALDIFIALKTCAGGSRFVLPSRYDPDIPMSKATLNQVTKLAYTAAQKDGKALGNFTVHDLRRTASTMLHEAGYNTDWIEKCLAHEQKGVRAVYNKAEYAEQRRAMLQDWADMIDRWATRPEAQGRSAAKRQPSVRPSTAQLPADPMQQGVS